MGYTERLSQQLAVVGTVDPQSATAETYLTDAIDMKQHRRVLFIVAVGALTSSNTTDFSVVGDPVTGGSYATTITGKAITQLTKAGSDDNKQVLVEVTAEECAAQGVAFIKGKLVTAAAAALACVIALADATRYGPASNFDLASVDEIVA
jgi:hypothetical protein